MPMKGSGTPELAVIDRFEGGVGWLAYPDERMGRASHALAAGGEVWVIDPVDAPGVDDLLADLGEVTGVAVLLDRHKRDAATIARRHGVSVAVPDWMTGVASKLDAPGERLGDELGGTGYEVQTIVDGVGWQEAGLYDGETLYVPEALGTVDYFRAPGESVGVHPMLRLLPPKRLRRLAVDRLLVGHGRGIEADADEAVTEAIGGARRGAPGLYLKTLKGFLGS